ncbi:hypothetical protein DN069_31210 [Streptacidiphilus pinicola]|uniref:Uncharacterized protein n=1 Tax=Streptacidiphilus pinicola TaxID=2219663 RepID=A0A2X0K2D9_9ACTN|nr:hypothetical protein [Streptacidiphilus pinicola]RAG81729.1 hypothetical protein DN069_31210 [Streptacidiphilus pinicola]
MPRYVHVPVDATAHLVRQAYEAGGPFQWAREAWKNSEESGASIIHFGIEEQAAENLGVLRRTIMDDGSGMKPDELRDFLTTFGGGGKPIGMDENFGQGFKSSVLPWNPYGVVVISYTDAAPEGAMLWIHRDHTGNYALREWEAADASGEPLGYISVVEPFMDDEHGCHWGLIRPDWMTTGTIMVLLGNAADSDTWMGDQDPSRKETVDDLIRYMNGRLLDIPLRDGQPIETTVIDLYAKRSSERRDTKDKSITLPDMRTMVWRPRRVHGLSHFIPETTMKGSVTVDSHGTRIDWSYIPEPLQPVGGTSDYITQRPTVVVDYQGEAYHSDSSKSRYRQFGVTDEIMGRTWLVVHPPVYSDARPTQWGVLTQASRHILISKGGRELPWDEWGDAFFQNFPEDLAKARDAARAANTTHSDPAMAKNLSRILDRLNPRFKASRVLSSAVGKIIGNPTGATAGLPGTRGGRAATGTSSPGGKGGTAGPRQILVPAAGGTAAGVNAAVRGGYPAFKWKDFDSDEAKYLALYVKNEDLTADGTVYRGVVYLNSKHPVFVQEFTYWADQVWPKADPAKVQELVERVYGEEAVAHVVHAQRLNGTLVARAEDNSPVVIGEDDVQALVEPTALSAALLGLINVEQRILTQGGGLFGSRATA